MDTSDKRPGENWLEYWLRKHDERHGYGCNCAWALANRGAVRIPVPGVEFDTVPAGKRLVLATARAVSLTPPSNP